jgi:hypothetical protein
MDQIIKSKEFLPVDIKQINYCPVYLQITTVSDMWLADGVTLNTGIAYGKRFHLSSKLLWLHFHQGRVNKHIWLSS